MSSYLVLARKYRPQQFSDIVGQLSVVKTLVNAIKLNRTHQAYVFSGSRGIGKTSIARIFSKALRCENRTEKNGLLYSCDRCSDCVEITSGNNVNVMEIDGASNNGVDSIREIREGAKFLPTTGNFKIYIIDEVHMLSIPAFNALLKTLEEPPEHVVFIFATTASHKIPETILGRCQRFDFKRVTVAEITERMKEILSAENINAEEVALSLIARAAEGSMRDALSILDQVIAYSGMKITADSVRDSIGLIGTELILALTKNILGRDVKSALQTAQQAFNQGVDLKVLVKMLIEMMHALILIQAGVEKPETHFNGDELEQIRQLTSLRSLEENELIFQVFHHGLELLSKASQPKLILDMLIIKTSMAEKLIRMDSEQDEPSEEALLEKTAGTKAVETRVTQAYSGLQFGKNPQTASAPAPEQNPMRIRNWEGFIEACFAHKPVVAVVLESVVEWKIPEQSGDVFKLGFREKDQAKAEQLQQKLFREQFTQMIEAYFGFKSPVEIFFSKNQGESMAEKAIRIRKETRDQKVQKVLSNQIIQEAKTLFGGEIEVELSEKEK